MKPIEAAIVRIHAHETDEIVGLGFLISENRIMTCAHVIADAVGIERDNPIPPPHGISMTFPLIDDDQTYSAGIVVWLPSRDGTDDIAVLELNETPPENATVANLVTLDELWNAEFGAYGFPRYNPKGVWASGRVRGTVEGKRIQIEDVEGTSYFIEPGFSGSPVYSNDPEIEGVIGMVVSAEADPSIKAGFMIPSSILLTKMNRRTPLTRPEEDTQAEPDLAKDISPIDMTANTSAPVPQIWRRKMRNRVVYIGKFEEMQRQLKTRRVFVAHHFFGGDTTAIKDYRYFLNTGLEETGYIPLFARDDSGTLLETICQDIISTEAGIYDVTDYNANVLIELGMSLGLNQPTVVIAKDDNKPLINPLQELNPLRYTDCYDLAENIGEVLLERIQAYRKSGMSPRFCAVCGLDCAARKPRQSPEKEYSLVGADPGKDKAIYHHLRQVIKEFDLNWQQIDDDCNLTVCQWVEQTRRCKLLFFHSKEGDSRHHGIDNATTMIRTGLAIGAGTAWRMILKQGERMPADLEGYKYVAWHASATAFDAALSSAVRQLLNENRPYSGIYDPLRPLEMIEDDTGLQELDDAVSPHKSYIFISYASGEDGSKELALSIQQNLGAIGVPTWLSRRRFETIRKYGENWREQIIPEARAMLLVGAKTSMQSKSVLEEMPLAVENNVPILLFHSTDVPSDTISNLKSRYDFQSITSLKPNPDNKLIVAHLDLMLKALRELESDKPVTHFHVTGDTFEEIFQNLQIHLENQYGSETVASIWSVEDESVRLITTSSDDEEIRSNMTIEQDKMLANTIGQRVAYGATGDDEVYYPIRNSGTFEPVTNFSRVTIPLIQDQKIIGVLGIMFDNPVSEVQINTMDSFLSTLTNALKSNLRRYDSRATEDKETIFISYSRQDADIARMVHDSLQSLGYNVWLDIIQLRPGTNWDHAIEAALESASTLLVVHTSSSYSSHNVWDEWNYFMRLQKRVIPLIFENFKLPLRLSGLRYIDLVMVSW